MKGNYKKTNKLEPSTPQVSVIQKIFSFFLLLFVATSFLIKKCNKTIFIFILIS